MKVKNYFGKYINFSLISNCVVFNTLAGCNKKKGGKGCSGSGKDKDHVIINNEQGTSGDENNKQQDDEEQKKREQEDQERKAKESQFQQNKNSLIQDFNNLTENLNKLNNVTTKMFDINVFNMSLNKTDVENCTEDTIDNITGKLNTNKTNFNKIFKTQFEALKNKYNELNKENNKKGDAKVSFDVTNIEAIINKSDITVDEFIKLNNELNNYNTLLTKGLEDFKKGLIDEYKKDTYKQKFELAKLIKNSFNYDFDSDYAKLNNSNTLEELQNINNIIINKSAEADKIIGDKKEALINDANTKLNEYEKIFIDLSLNDMKIPQEDFAVLKTINISTVKDFNDITDKLNKLTNEINKIKTDFKDFFISEFTKVLDKAQGCELIDLLETYIDKIKKLKEKPVYCNNGVVRKINDDLEKYYAGKLEKNIYIKIKKDKDNNKILFVYDNQFFTNFSKHYKNKEKIDGYEEVIINAEEYSTYCIFENVYFDTSKTIIFDCNCLLTDESKEKAHIAFYTVTGKGEMAKNDLFFLESKNKNLSQPIKNSNYSEKCTELKILKVSDDITSTAYMFKNFSSLESLDVSNFDTRNVTNMEGMFFYCEKLTKIIGIDNLNTDKVTNMKLMFRNCAAFVSLDLSNFDTSNVTTMASMFSGCKNLKEIKGINNLNTDKVTNMKLMFNCCEALESLNVSSFNTENVTTMESMFFYCEKLTKIEGIDKLNTTNVTNMKDMFRGCKALESLNVSSFNTKNVTNMEGMFECCEKLREIVGINKLNTTNVTNMSSLFKKCKALESLNVSSFNTKNVTNMEGVFECCEKLREIVGINKLNTTNVTNMSSLFKKCEALESLNVSSFNTENVTTMFSMFYGCNKLKNLDLSNFKDTKLTSASYMFDECTNLKIINLESFTFEKDENTLDIFAGCTNLEKINEDVKNKLIKKNKDIFKGTKIIDK